MESIRVAKYIRYHENVNVFFFVYSCPAIYKTLKVIGFKSNNLSYSHILFYSYFFINNWYVRFNNSDIDF